MINRGQLKAEPDSLPRPTQSLAGGRKWAVFEGASGRCFAESASGWVSAPFRVIARGRKIAVAGASAKRETQSNRIQTTGPLCGSADGLSVQ
jgi:hypothetical protein